tara:strand:- start:2096 stop:3991 length:1896 start_codon:yes stop_codon:yes gene_type:complete
MEPKIGFSQIRNILIIISLFHHGVGFTQLKLARIFSDHMVLQRGKEIPIWGYGNPGENVTVRFSATVVSSEIDNYGKWKVLLPEYDAGGPYTLTITGNDSVISYKDILIGDVWLATGQSNMTHPLDGWDWLPDSRIYRFEEELQDTNYPEIRLFHVSKFPASYKVDDFYYGEWQIASPVSVKEFSSIGWFFGKSLYKDLKVPIGIIHSSWGGSKIEAWMSNEAYHSVEGVKAFPDVNRKDEEWKQKMQDYINLTKQRRMQISFPLIEVESELIKSRYDDSGWEEVNFEYENPEFGNVVWLRKRVEIPDYFAKDYMRLSLGALDRQSTVYFNGHKIAFFLYPEKAWAYIPRSIVLPGENVITIRISQPWEYARVRTENYEMSITNNEGSFVQSLLNGWKFNDHIETVQPEDIDYYNLPSHLFNGMINGMIPYALKGIIWNQGSTGYPDLYDKTLSAMILDWRNRWGDDMYFYLYQSGSPVRRDLQEKVLSLPKTGWAYNSDLRDTYDVHAKNKDVHAERMALRVKKEVYGMDLVAEGPKVEKVSYSNDKVILDFEANNPPQNRYYEKIHGFEIAGKDEKYYSADAILDGNRVILSSNQVKKPLSARYGWNRSDEMTLYNKEGLPVEPFKIVQ